jgi:hypothetical protein
MLSEQTGATLAFEEVRQLPEKYFESFEDIQKSRREAQLESDLETIALSERQAEKGEDSLEVPPSLIPESLLEEEFSRSNTEQLVIISEEQLAAHGSPLTETVATPDYGIELRVALSLDGGMGRTVESVTLVRFEREKRLTSEQEDESNWNPIIFLQEHPGIDFIQQVGEYSRDEFEIQPYHSLESLQSVEPSLAQENIHLMKVLGREGGEEYFQFSSVYTHADFNMVTVETAIKRVDVTDLAVISSNGNRKVTLSDSEFSELDLESSGIALSPITENVAQTAKEAAPKAISMSWGGSFRVIYIGGEGVIQEKGVDGTYTNVEKYPGHEDAYLKTLAIYEELLEAYAMGQTKEIVANTVNGQPDGTFLISTSRYSINSDGEITLEGVGESVDAETARQFMEENPDAVCNLAQGSIIELQEAGDDDSEYLYSFELQSLAKDDEQGTGGLLTREGLIAKLTQWIQPLAPEEGSAKVSSPFIFHGKDGEIIEVEQALELLLQKRDEIKQEVGGDDGDAEVIIAPALVVPKAKSEVPSGVENIKMESIAEGSSRSEFKTIDVVSIKKITQRHEVINTLSESEELIEPKKLFSISPIEYKKETPTLTLISNRLVPMPAIGSEKLSRGPALPQSKPREVLEVRTLVTESHSNELDASRDNYLVVFHKEDQSLNSPKPLLIQPPAEIAQEVTIPLIEEVPIRQKESVQIISRIKLPESSKDSQIVTAHISLQDLVPVRPKNIKSEDAPTPPSLWLALDSRDSTSELGLEELIMPMDRAIPLPFVSTINLDYREVVQEKVLPTISSNTSEVSQAIEEVTQETTQEVGIVDLGQSEVAKVESIQTVSAPVARVVTNIRQYSAADTRPERSVN